MLAEVNSPKLYSLACTPAPKAMPLMALGVTATAVAVPPAEPAVVMPFCVGVLPNSGCAVCSVTA